MLPPGSGARGGGAGGGEGAAGGGAGGASRASGSGLVDASPKRLGSGSDAARARARYNAAMQALAERARQSTAPDLLVEARQAVHGLVARVPAAGAEATLQSLDAYAGELARARLRTAEMVSHALDAAQLEDLRERLRSARPGQAVDCSELRQAEGVVAWSLVCAPSDADEGVIA